MSKGLNIIPKPKRILVTVPLDITFGRELLTGIFRYIKSNRCQWSIDISGAQTDCRAILPGKQPFYDGIITTNPEITLPLLQNGKGGGKKVAVRDTKFLSAACERETILQKCCFF